MYFRALSCGWVHLHAFFIAFSSDSRMVQRNKEETYRQESQEDKSNKSLGEARKRDLGEAGKEKEDDERLRKFGPTDSEKPIK